MGAELKSNTACSSFCHSLFWYGHGEEAGKGMLAEEFFEVSIVQFLCPNSSA